MTDFAWKLTPDGRWATVLAVALLVVSVLARHNLAALMAAPLWAVLLLSVPLGRWHLRGLEPRRVLPAELYAGRDAPGRLVLANPRRTLGAWAVDVVDEGTGASVTVPHAAPGGAAEGAVSWRFGARGRTHLDAVVVRSTFPFGLVEHSLRHPLPADLVVWPRPVPAGSPAGARAAEGTDDDLHTRGTGDFLGLRAWRQGDPLRLVHARRSARLGSLVVVERAGETERAVHVQVPEGQGPAWEREVGRACGEILRAFQLGRRVGLSLPATADRPAATWPPSAGAAWRRTLLDELATLPKGGP
jgi:uncharacterized protein (DUF58 family)